MMITLPGAGHELQRTLAIALTTESPISANPESLCYGSLVVSICSERMTVTRWILLTRIGLLA